jgi:hypothetical protein
MHIITAEFRRLSDLTIPDLLGEIGVYVLWDGHAKARPTYIGEGNVLQRLVRHESRFAKPLDGFAAILTNRNQTWQRAKADGTIVEALLLRVASDTDRSPAVNVAPGQLRALDAIFGQHGTVRINVTGCDPLRPPEELPILARPKQIILRDSRDGDLEVQHDWRLRRRRRG